MNVLYGILINAEQAASLALDSKGLEQIRKQDYVVLEKIEELSRINETIQDTAALGGYSFKTWIKYFDTYNQLVKEGYIVKGGVVQEAMPVEKQAQWGNLQDRFVVSWGGEVK